VYVYVICGKARDQSSSQEGARLEAGRVQQRTGE
jgi:hypothetical protein